MTEPEEPRAGEMRVVGHQLQHYVPPVPGGWQVMPLHQAPREYRVATSGVWYVARDMAAIWHAEMHDLMELRRLGRAEREVAKVLLREALRTLDEMED